MSDRPDVLKPRSLLGLLLRVRARGLWNRVCHAVDDAPLRVSASVVLVAVIWLGVYFMFRAVFAQLQRTPLEMVVAIPLIFNFFFAAMMILLTFSNALIAYGSLFGKNESAYLLTSPLMPLDVVTLKYAETVFLASWALILLGIPLMASMAEQANHPTFYFLFLAFFLAFIPIPGALGLAAAWAAARFFPRRMVGAAAGATGIAVAVAMAWGLQSIQIGQTATEEWLRSFLERMSFVESAFLPNNWVASGIDHALHNHFGESAMYLCVTIANALFLSWLVVRFVAGRFESAYDRASSGRASGRKWAAEASRGIAGSVFFYLPLRLRLIAAKDLRTFCRDPLQWSQLVILFGLLVLYLTNMPTLRLQLSGGYWPLIIPFLNLSAISLILATFSCRFVFPLVSLEGQKLWLIGLLPLPRGRILLAKFAFAMTVTLTVALCSMGLAAVMLRLNAIWTVIHLAVIVAICFGLCGFAVGIGARLPMFGETNTGRIANGFGGTTNLLASVALVTVVLAGVGMATWWSKDLREDALPHVKSLLACGAAVLISVVAGTTALILGARHFNRIEA